MERKMKLLVAAAAAALIASPVLAQAPTVATVKASSVGADAGTKANGEIKSIDAKAGTVTIHHSPIPALGWPAMTMTFKATPDALKVAKSGQTVFFTLKGPENQVVAIEPK
jgi:Cu(I)/Ag(I) efflux system protein CusF